MVHSNAVAAAWTAIALGLVACAEDGPPGNDTDVTVFEGARIIVGDGSAPIEAAVLVVEEGTIAAVGPGSAVEVPESATRIDLSGRTIMPAIVNAHVHLAQEREARMEQLQHMAYWGAGVVVSLGHDSSAVAFEMLGETVPDGARSITAGRGITTPEPGRSEAPYWITSEEEAREAVRELAGQGVGLIKIWVDDRNGQYEKLSPALYGAIIDEAHTRGVRVTAHVYSLEDAKGLLRAGIDAFAHGIRDRDVDDELVTLWQERPGVVLVPNLPDPGVAQDLTWLTATVPPADLDRIQAASVDRPDAQERFGIQARNLARLHDAGVKIAFGTDGSVPWAVHLEMEDMVRSGMTPSQVIAAATGSAAEFMQLTDVGSIAVGKRADFIVLEANPLDDIANTRRIEAVYLGGNGMDRDVLAARFRTGTTR